jgi:long-subunit acyl-CoA synthetase (AMP-forming)
VSFFDFKDLNSQAETVDADGWVHSGDIGLWDAQGRLKIFDRKKKYLFVFIQEAFTKLQYFQARSRRIHCARKD